MQPFLFFTKSPLAGTSAAVLIFSLARMSLAAAQPPAPIVRTHANRAPEPAAANGRAMLNRYCVSCHNQRSKTGGLMLDRMNLARVPDQAEIWEKVVHKLHAGAMPPTGLPRPDRAATDAFTKWLETKLDAAATGALRGSRAGCCGHISSR